MQICHQNKRPYRRQEDWITTYRELEDAGEVITHKNLVILKYCKSEVSARKLTSRHRKAGILVAEGTKCPESFRLPKNVTPSIETRTQKANAGDIAAQVLVIEQQSSMKTDQICQSTIRPTN